MTQTRTIFFPIIIALLATALLVGQAEAKTVVRSGESVSISEDQVIEGNFYSAASKIYISGEVKDDMAAAGGQITINGSVGRDALLAAGSVEVHGIIGEDLRIISGEVTIAEPVMGDVFVVGGSVHILSSASIGGDLLLYAGEATVEGPVGGNINGGVGKLRIDSNVAGDVDVRVTDLTLGERASVEGSVLYVSNELVTQALNATIAGELVRSDPVIVDGQFNLRASLVPVLMLVFATLAWFLVSRRTLSRVTGRALVASPRPILLGLATLFLTPLVIGILLVSMVGLYIGMIALFGYLLLLMLGFVGLVAVIGQLLMKVFNQPHAHLSLLSLVVGIVGVTLLMMLPVIGQVLIILFMLTTLGSIVDLLLRPGGQ